MSVPPRDFHRLIATRADRIFATIVDLYGRKMADEIARKVIDPTYQPIVIWPDY